MDGVIVDSNPVHREAWTAFNGRFGLETTEAMLQRTNGWRNDRIIRHFFGEGLPAEEVIARGAAKEALYRELMGPILERMLVPGIRRFLKEYSSAPMAMATNADPPNVDFLLDRAELRSYLRTVVTGAHVEHPKPHPEIYLRTAELLATAPRNCIVFEDSLSGVEAARAADMRVVGISTTFGYLPGTNLTVDNFESRDLSVWLAQQSRVD